MNCKLCGTKAFRTNTQSLAAGKVTRRRRKCSRCSRAFWTLEVEQTAASEAFLEREGIVPVGSIPLIRP